VVSVLPLRSESRGKSGVVKPVSSLSQLQPHTLQKHTHLHNEVHQQVTKCIRTSSIVISNDLYHYCSATWHYSGLSLCNTLGKNTLTSWAFSTNNPLQTQHWRCTFVYYITSANQVSHKLGSLIEMVIIVWCYQSTVYSCVEITSLHKYQHSLDITTTVPLTTHKLYYRIQPYSLKFSGIVRELLTHSNYYQYNKSQWWLQF